MSKPLQCIYLVRTGCILMWVRSQL